MVFVDHARVRKAGKRRGEGRSRVPLTAAMDVATVAEAADPDQMLALDAAVSKLEAVNPEAGAVVRLRFYAGLTVEQTAEAPGLSPATVKRQWTYARVWLFAVLSGDGASGGTVP